MPPDKVKEVLTFATKKPHERLASIRAGLGVSVLLSLALYPQCSRRLQVLAYGQSEYVRVSICIYIEWS